MRVRLHVIAALVCACGARTGLPMPGGGGGGGSDGSGGVAAATAATVAISSAQGTGGAGGQLEPCVPLTSDAFNPEEVYLFGTRMEGSCARALFAHWCDPNTAIAGLDDCGIFPGNFAIRPNDGRFLYARYEGGPMGPIRELRCDICPYSAMTPYPEDPNANDVLVPSLGCAEAQSFLVSPTGELVSRCPDGVYYDAAGTPVFPSPQSIESELLHLGSGGSALTPTRVVDLATGVEAPITGLPAGPIYTARATSDGGFRVVVGDDLDLDLYAVASNGVATHLGAYPPLPDGVQAYAVSSKLDGSGRVYQIGSLLGESFVDVVVRREIRGPSEIVYDELGDPLVKLHAGALVTAP